MSQQAQKRPLTLCEAEERAAIIEDGCGVSRHKSEALTAQIYGCKTWQELIDHIGGDYG